MSAASSNAPVTPANALRTVSTRTALAIGLPRLETEEARARPTGARHLARDDGERRPRLAVPLEAILGYQYLMRLTVPVAHEACARLQSKLPCFAGLSVAELPGQVIAYCPEG